MMELLARRYADKVAVVTGAGSGIGRAIARRIVAEGGAVAAGDIVTDSVVPTSQA
jgi:NAD(P)-dependent dehydrogenase (short-subunit alcohol dehydrogenase family)